MLCCAVCLVCPIKVCADGENPTAQQNTIGLTEEDENSLYSNFIDLGINSEVAENLVQKYKSTGLIDAIDEKKSRNMFKQKMNMFVVCMLMDR